MSPVLVEARGVARRYGAGCAAITALHPASFAIRRGDRIALVGSSGSGKSTLLNLIAGLERPTAGVIEWPGLGSRETLRPLRVGVIHQLPALIPTLTVAENVALPLVLGQVLQPEEADYDALAAVGLEALAERLPGALSGGEAQRAVITRALAHRPPLLLADEPTGQLDRAGGQAAITAIIQRLPPDGALVVASHDPAVADRLPIRWRMEHGRLLPDAGRPAA
jgi:ABC-type lipoprotein export system ATPase subunit